MSLIARKIMVGNVVDGLPVHQSFDSAADQLTDPVGAKLQLDPCLIDGNFIGTPTPSSKIFLYMVADNIILPENLLGSQFWAETAPSTTTAFELLKYVGMTSISIGSIVFNSDGTFNVILSETPLYPGELLCIVAPADLNGIANITWTIDAELVKEYISTPAEAFVVEPSGLLTSYDFSYGTDVIIPESLQITAIGSDAFNPPLPPSELSTAASTGLGTTTPRLTSIYLPDGITHIHVNAFRDHKLYNVRLPETLTSIGDGAFENNLLSWIYLPKNLESIGIWAFAGNNLAGVAIPDSVVSLGAQAFHLQRYRFMSTINIGSGITTIEPGVFSDNAITRIMIKSGITIGGHYAMGDYDSLFVAFYNANNKAGGTYTYSAVSGWSRQATSVRYFTFHEPSQTITKYNYDSALVSDLVIPAQINGVDVLKIGAEACVDSWLTSVSIPDTVTEIQQAAFANNEIRHVVIPDTVVSLGLAAFENNRLETIVISENVKTIFARTFFDSSVEPSVLTTVTIGSDVVFDAGSIPGDVAFIGSMELSLPFVNYYNSQGRLAGTYIYSGGGVWTKQ